jgi:Eco29kI restriction endonuclease
MKSTEFDRKKHIYKSEAFVELVKDAVRFFNVEEFMCRFVIFEDESSDMISTIEAALIKLSQPLWNVALDGFGNHDPGKGRYEQAKSDWDVIHPGRIWAKRCKGIPKAESVIFANIDQHFQSIGGQL